MISLFSRLLFISVFIGGAAIFANAQGADATTRNGVPREDVPKNVQESLAKQRIARDKKDYADLLSRGEEAVKLSGELEKSFEQNNQLSAEDKKKLDRLEKIVKKIRNEIGADGDDDKEAYEIDNKPLSVMNALKALKSSTANLVDELKKSTRYSISVIAVESSSLLLKVVRFLRFGKN